MQRSQTFIIAGMMLVLGFTAWALAELLNQRFESGTVYPPYSTQRTDPLGAKALMEALDRLPNVECSQNFLRVEKLQGSQQTALFFLNVTPSSWQDGKVIQGDFLKQFVTDGGRVVVSLASTATGWGQLEEDARQRQLKEEREEREKEEEQKKKNEEPNDESKEVADTEDKEDKKETQKKRHATLFKTPQSLEKVFGITFEKGKFVLTPRGGYELTVNDNSKLKGMELPEWYSKASINLPEDKKADVEKPWEILATVNDKPMIIKRSMGLGSMVICTDSYFASNEALWKEPSAEFLYWLTDGRKTILFDETHLGTREQPGIMHLARKFRLHGFFVGGIVLFGLFVWQSTMSLVPSSETADNTSSVSGHGATAGLVSLLRRGVPRQKLLQKSFETWEKNTPVLSSSMKARIEQARQLIPDDKTKLPKGVAVKLYQQIRDILHPKRY